MVYVTQHRDYIVISDTREIEILRLKNNRKIESNIVEAQYSDYFSMGL